MRTVRSEKRRPVPRARAISVVRSPARGFLDFARAGVFASGVFDRRGFGRDFSSRRSPSSVRSPYRSDQPSL
jgi:hypothetical protein